MGGWQPPPPKKNSKKTLPLMWAPRCHAGQSARGGQEWSQGGDSRLGLFWRPRVSLSQILKNWWMIDSNSTVEQHERNTRVFECVVSLAASDINQPLQKDGARSSVGIRPRCQRTFCCSHCSDFDTRARCTTRGTRPWGPCSLPCQPRARCVWISRLLPHTPMAPVGHGRGFV
jgi:hypothetical protein